MISNLKALDILSADVDDKVHIRPEFFRRRIVCNRLNQPKIDTKCVFDDLLPVAGRCGREHFGIRVVPVKIGQEIPDQRHRISGIGKIARADDIFILVDNHCLYRSGTGIDPDINFPGAGPIHLRDRVFGVAGTELVVFCLASKKRFAAFVVLFCGVLGDSIRRLQQIESLGTGGPDMD